MKLSARSRYATRILLELAQQKDALPLSAAALSHQTGVSVQFVEQILKPLKQHGFTTSVRGAAGGHTLARPAEDITLGDVVRLMEGGVNLSVCCGEKANDCPRQSVCLTRTAWQRVSLNLEQELDAISLATLLADASRCLGRPRNSLPSAKPENASGYHPRNSQTRQAKKAVSAVQGHPPRITAIRKARGMRTI